MAARQLIRRSAIAAAAAIALGVTGCGGDDNPNTFEKVWNWPFDAPGEGTISDGSGVVAHQDDLHWDASEKVYDLVVEGHDQLHYQRIDGEWKLVEKVGGEWQPVK